MNDIRIDFFSSSPIFSVENWTSKDVKTFFCSSLDFGRKIGIVFICVDLCGVRHNKLLNLGVRDLKKVENRWIKVYH